MLNKRMTILVIFSLTGAGYASVLVDDYYSFCGCLILSTLKNTTNGPQAEQILHTMTLSRRDQAQCDNWDAYPGYNITTFSDSLGRSTTNLSISTGVFAPDAYAFCGPPKVKQVCS